MFKRVALFLATNLAVLALVSVVMSILGVNANQFGGLLVMAALFGFGGSIISLLVSKWMAKRATGAHVIDTPRNEAEQWLLATVRRQAQQAGIGMPEVAIYDAPEINAFATGANRNNALVAVSTGLLRAMSRDEAEAVLGHEISHVANGDMVTLTLIQGVVNTFVIFLSRVIGYLIDRRDARNRPNSHLPLDPHHRFRAHSASRRSELSLCRIEAPRAVERRASPAIQDQSPAPGTVPSMRRRRTARM